MSRWRGRAATFAAGCAAAGLVWMTLGATTDDGGSPPPASPQTQVAGEPTAPPVAATNAWQVTSIVDGDTIYVTKDGVSEEVRLAGMDTPERGVCGYAEATAYLESLLSGKSVALVAGSRDDRDKYDRLIRYVDVSGLDAGLEQIKAGFAIARYDSRDGYGEHQREAQYVSADAETPDFVCGGSEPSAPPQPEPTAETPPQPSDADCHPNYAGVCLPIVDDVDCAEVPDPVVVIGPDPYRLDRDNDGVGCESS